MCVYIEMRPILCTKIHILCATTCAHSFCNKRRFFVFSFLIYFTRCCFFFFFTSSSFSSSVVLLMPLFVYIGRCFFSPPFSSSLHCDTAAFWLHQITFWHLSFCYGSFSFNGRAFIDLINSFSNTFPTHSIACKLGGEHFAWNVSDILLSLMNNNIDIFGISWPFDLFQTEPHQNQPHNLLVECLLLNGILMNDWPKKKLFNEKPKPLNYYQNVWADFNFPPDSVACQCGGAKINFINKNATFYGHFAIKLRRID